MVQPLNTDLELKDKIISGDFGVVEITSMCSLMSNEYKDTKCGHCEEIMDDPICINGIIYDRQHIMEYSNQNDGKCPSNIVIRENI